MNERTAVALSVKEMSITYSALKMRCDHLAKAIDQFDTLGWNDYKERAHVEYAQTRELQARIHGLMYNISGKTFGEK